MKDGPEELPVVSGLYSEAFPAMQCLIKRELFEKLCTLVDVFRKFSKAQSACQN
jgi:hypothetical protein